MLSEHVPLRILWNDEMLSIIPSSSLKKMNLCLHFEMFNLLGGLVPLRKLNSS